ncbi:type II toxin-antitoxin system RelE/ParE family toxin [Rhizobium sp. YS-1r]|uniref:type II toxin-antitoxin system RelE/ParE family toxin n=1 Tax=Rhizobium sp. YS-1r TaxID=1532558 RepID=UPI000510313B|nr:type II toxin-antitoxin system RelE/ParE family toxin [Rhizobium sp. YS-1r]KGD85929.1 recombinase [Rhizobium sp. YS-1r]
MSHRVIFGPKAAKELEDIMTYLAPRMGVEAAREYVRKIESYCLGFATFPKRGMLRDDIRPGLRLVGYRYKATIAFSIEEDIVMIIRIFHRGRNVDFGDEPDDLV